MAASHSTWNSFSNLGSARIGAIDNFSLIEEKLCSASSSQWNFIFFIHSIMGATMLQKFMTNNLMNVARPWKLRTSPIIFGVGHLRIAITFTNGQLEFLQHSPQTLKTTNCRSWNYISSNWYKTYSPTILLEPPLRVLHVQIRFDCISNIVSKQP